MSDIHFIWGSII